LILFWPFVALTGHYLSDRLAVTVFCAVGIAVSLGLLRALWRRYFAEVSVGVVGCARWRSAWRRACRCCCRSPTFTRWRSVAVYAGRCCTGGDLVRVA